MAQAETLNTQSAPTESHNMRRVPSDRRSISNVGSQSGSHREQVPCSVPNCCAVLSSKSVHKKHMLKHDKAFVCTIQGCKRNGKGFATVNDLDRHRKSVHKIDSHRTKSYRCAHDDCRNKPKIWPRLDNFKQHIGRMHRDYDDFELIKNSECHLQEPPSADPALLADLVCETAVSTSNPGGMVSAVPQSYLYPPLMSLGGCPTSGTSQVSPSTESLDASFPQSGTPPPSRADDDPSTIQNWAQTAESIHNRQATSRNSARTSSAGPVEHSVSAQGTTSNRNMGSQSKPSSVAQTKSEQQQQRQALEKLSKAKLEEMLLRIIGSQQQDGGNSRSDSESCQLSQEIARLTHKGVRSTRLQSRRSNQGSTPGMEQCPYDGCDFSGRICDLNKHKKRHEKPYGCTYPKCYKKFGAKSDWKRHENSQHFQQEAFRCDLKNSPDEQCGQYYYRTAQFHKHLELEHKVTSKTILQNGLDRCKIGKNYQVQFWCGFCREIIPLVHRGNAAWDERFSHIANHFEKDVLKKCIDDWICVEENRTKRQLQEVMLDEKEKGLDAEELDDDESTAAEGTANCFPEPLPNGSRRRSPSPGTTNGRAATRLPMWLQWRYGSPGQLHGMSAHLLSFL
ncbi:uncharacterized protein EKO05_0002175 [Ascochyta rabiei]|nr:uncharacterized protein EKO05_0002175 [Ascochyta rabiei]UPX11576.1 hypothetical protein EKO05_0002175 [Ascochyta rabiei]